MTSGDRAKVHVPRAALLEALRARFGHPSFRAGQEEIIRSLFEQRDVLAVLPTGAGKSVVYELAAQFLAGLSIVVSPLLALMKDQVDALAAAGVDARALNSAQSESAMEEALDSATRGDTRLLYVTPERFDNVDFVHRLCEVSVSLFVVDEAHSISEWGHSFRPAYLSLSSAIAQLGRPPVLALTATATPWVRRDIIEQLGMREPHIVVRDTDRPNLFLEVVRVEEERQDRTILQQLFEGELSSALPESLREVMHGSGIIYTATTRAAEETAGWLTQWGISADYYHGRRTKTDRERVQSAFMEGHVQVIAATNAFGLGIDKPDVRFVIHRDIPPSLEAYYQEAGRAGRDGNLARCVLIYRVGDLGRAAFLAGGGELSREDVARGRAGLVSLRTATPRELQTATGLGRADVERLLELLESEGIVSRSRGRYRLLVDDFDETAVPLEREEQRRAYERSRLDMMRGYAELRECRRRYILNYFGEDSEWERCGRCDVDAQHAASGTGSAAHTDPVAPFAIHDRVVHASLGEGVVQRVSGDTLSVLFDKVGYKTLGTDIVQEQHLLRKLVGPT
jgi:ATP-dependent DNA helicase RecQ